MKNIKRITSIKGKKLDINIMVMSFFKIQWWCIFFKLQYSSTENVKGFFWQSLFREYKLKSSYFYDEINECSTFLAYNLQA